ncbi:hypothetical protein ATANTOWER_029676 [Ataeniobius toweri]|uniref:Uncharacterized protein n=1 Tax=Ataeniobius toweri TaxID=208326 RepID=A0ABU7AIL1_9TELE|nr:hypothetical protein [Ataeniobius toweri]
MCMRVNRPTVLPETLGAKPRKKSLPSDLGRLPTGRTLQLDKKAWLTILFILGTTRTLLTTNDRSKATENTGIPQETRFVSLLKDPDTLSESLSSERFLPKRL